MKYFICLLACANVLTSIAQNKKKFNDTSFLPAVEITAIRASEKNPFAKTNILKKDIEKNNTGKDLPFLLNETVAVVTNSDAGNTVGYTGIRIRGTDASRINVTLNGIPYNDAESQGTFFVDLPDIASSTNSIQIQRGAGTSTNGAGAFGANINLSTNELKKDFGIDFNNSYGSFNTFKTTLQVSSGLLKNNFTIDARLSNIKSDGYIDRATSSLQSFFISGAYINQNSSLRLNIFSGKEKTYQAWNGVPEILLNDNRTYNSSGTEKMPIPYENETDNYKQTHYQLFFNKKINTKWQTNIAAFLTTGNGYYEQYKTNKKLADYGLPNYTNGSTIITKVDLIRQLWLDNNFYGSIFSALYKYKKTQLTFGGSITKYDGKHFGKIIWASVQQAVPNNYKWYSLTACKKDYNIYTKWAQQLNNNWQSFVDVQLRHVNYNINGFRDNPTLFLNNNFTFLNPKVGATYTKNNFQYFISYSKATKEPNREDFEANTNEQPKAEHLNDFETGISYKTKNYSLGATAYYMLYKNQLVLTGKINDVGAYTRTNIDNSYRLGLELEAATIINKKINLNGNIAFSRNKIKNFKEYIDDYDNGGQKINEYASTTIAFSPSVVGSLTTSITPVTNFKIDAVSKFVSRQYLDNTANKNRSLNSFFVQNLYLNYTLYGKKIKETVFIAQLNNIFSKMYEPNGYTFSYIYGGSLTTENYYFPMAGFNVMFGVNIKL